MVGKMDERSDRMPVNPHVCFHFDVIDKDRKQWLRFKDEVTNGFIFLQFCAFSSPTHLMESR